MPLSVNIPSMEVVRSHTSGDGTLSEVKVTKNSIIHRFYGVERPWRDNEPFRSCIPSGQYVLLPWSSPQHKSCYIFAGGEVALYEGNAKRYACLIHVGNWARDVQGCLAIGMTQVINQHFVGSSRVAMGKLKDLLGDEPCTVDIRWME